MLTGRAHKEHEHAGHSDFGKKMRAGSQAAWDSWNAALFPLNLSAGSPLLPYCLSLDLWLCRLSGFAPALFLSSEINRDFYSFLTAPKFVCSSLRAAWAMFVPGKVASLIIFTFQQLLFRSWGFIKMLILRLLQVK